MERATGAGARRQLALYGTMETWQKKAGGKEFSKSVTTTRMNDKIHSVYLCRVVLKKSVKCVSLARGFKLRLAAPVNAG